jgi:NADH:ubiquinone oxidoreductase subunit 6 (subunit J)
MMEQVMKPAFEQQAISARPWRWMRRVALSLGLVVLAGVAAGLIVGSIDHGHGISGRIAAILTLVVLLAIGCFWLLVRELRTPTGEEPPTRQERLNRNLLIVSGALGGLTAAVLMLAGRQSGSAELFSNAPLPPALALALVLLLGIAVPVIAYFWHRNVDEQEADAYKTGALYGMYVFGVGAPTWWLAARGGLVPPPNGFVIYYATITVVGVIWIWKKYR